MINPLTVIGILRTISRYTPPLPPQEYDLDEKKAYLVGWTECAAMFEDQAIIMVEREDQK